MSRHKVGSKRAAAHKFRNAVKKTHRKNVQHPIRGGFRL